MVTIGALHFSGPGGLMTQLEQAGHQLHPA